MTVFEKIKELNIAEMATLIAQMVDHEVDPCTCPIGVFHRNCPNEGHCRFSVKGCDESALEWLKSEDELFLDVPRYLWQEDE